MQSAFGVDHGADVSKAAHKLFAGAHKAGANKRISSAGKWLNDKRYALAGGAVGAGGLGAVGYKLKPRGDVAKAFRPFGAALGGARRATGGARMAGSAGGGARRGVGSVRGAMNRSAGAMRSSLNAGRQQGQQFRQGYKAQRAGNPLGTPSSGANRAGSWLGQNRNTVAAGAAAGTVAGAGAIGAMKPKQPKHPQM